MLDDILNQVRAIGAETHGLHSPRAATPKVYEVWVLSQVVKAVRELTGAFCCVGYDLTYVPRMRFRLSPGRITSTSATFILMEYRGVIFELHVGVRTRGASKVPHELDISILQHSLAQKARDSDEDPPQGAVCFLAECKHYTSSKIPLSLGREFLGLNTEFRSGAKVLVASKDHDGIERLLHSHQADFFAPMKPKARRERQRFVHWLAVELKKHLREIR